MKASLKKISALEINTLIFPHGGIDHISDINTIIQALFSEIDQKTDFLVGLLMPLTKFSPEIKKLRSGV